MWRVAVLNVSKTQYRRSVQMRFVSKDLPWCGLVWVGFGVSPNNAVKKAKNEHIFDVKID